MEYTDKVLENFLSPQNAYLMDDADAVGKKGDYGCGDSVIFYIKVKENIISEISYLVYGCPASIATSSALSIMAKGRTLECALKITEKDVEIALDGLPERKKHCSNLGVSALKRAISNYNNAN
jgi:nitrogen fixation protein NifU and related proteins